MQPVINPNDIINNWHWFAKHSNIDEPAEMVMAKCLARQYKMLEGIMDDKQISLVTYQMRKTLCIVTSIYSISHARKMRELFFDYLRTNENATMLEAKTLVNPKVFARFSTMERAYTVFRKVL